MDAIINVHLKGPFAPPATPLPTGAQKANSKEVNARIISTNGAGLLEALGDNYSAAKAGIASLTLYKPLNWPIWHHRQRHCTFADMTESAFAEMMKKPEEDSALWILPTSPLVAWLAAQTLKT